MSKLKYITDDIDALDAAEHELESKGVPRAHIHVLSRNETELTKHDLPGYSDWSKSDLWHNGTRGALIGFVLASAMICITYALGYNDPVTWTAMCFAAVVVMGFCTWEGGLIGVAKLNREFEKYREAIDRGEHLLVVDASDAEEERKVLQIVSSKPAIKSID